MAVFKDIQEARDFFQGDRFAMESGVVLEELGDGYSVCSLALSDEVRDADGPVPGGALFTLADFAFAAAANHRHRPTVTRHVSVHYLRPVRGERLLARAECQKDGRRSCVYQITVTDELGRDIAWFTETGHKV